MFSLLFDDYDIDAHWGLILVTMELQAFPRHDVLPVPKVINHDFRLRFLAHPRVRPDPPTVYA